MIKKLSVLGIIILLMLIPNISAVSIDLNCNIKNNENSEINSLNFISADIYIDDNADPSWYDATHVKTIYEGINSSSEGNTIFVYNGTYNETKQIQINKTINLIGENKNITIIDGCGIEWSTISILADFVNISGFTIINSGGYWEFPEAGIQILANYSTIKNNIFRENYIGLWVRQFYELTSNYNTISDNLFINDTFKVSGSNNTINNNNFLFNNPYEAALLILSSNDNLISENTFSGKFYDAIYIDGSQNNIIKQNNIQGSSGTIAIRLIDSKQNNVHYNTIKNNTVGVVLMASKFNKIHHNNFFNCLIKGETAFSYCNSWYGNYWGRPSILPNRIIGIGGLVFGRFNWFPRILPNEI